MHQRRDGLFQNGQATVMQLPFLKLAIQPIAVQPADRFQTPPDQLLDRTGHGIIPRSGCRSTFPFPGPTFGNQRCQLITGQTGDGGYPVPVIQQRLEQLEALDVQLAV